MYGFKMIALLSLLGLVPACAQFGKGVAEAVLEEQGLYKALWVCLFALKIGNVVLGLHVMMTYNQENVNLKKLQSLLKLNLVQVGLDNLL